MPADLKMCPPCESGLSAPEYDNLYRHSSFDRLQTGGPNSRCPVCGRAYENPSTHQAHSTRSPFARVTSTTTNLHEDLYKTSTPHTGKSRLGHDTVQKTDARDLFKLSQSPVVSTSVASSNVAGENSVATRNRRRRKKFLRILCLVSWVLCPLLCCFINRCVREPPRDENDLMEDPCFPMKYKNSD